MIERWAVSFPLSSEESGRPHTAMAGAVWRRVTNKKTGEASEGCRFYASSVEPYGKRMSNNKWLLRMSREHWSVENNIHWVRDAVNGEDRMRIRAGNIAAALGLLGTALLALHRAAGHTSPTQAGEHFSDNHAMAVTAIKKQRLSRLNG